MDDAEEYGEYAVYVRGMMRIPGIVKMHPQEGRARLDNLSKNFSHPKWEHA